MIKHFGIQVRDCTEALATKNNAVTVAAFRANKKANAGARAVQPIAGVAQPEHDKVGVQTRRSAPSAKEKDISRSDVLLDPIPGNIYTVRWGKAKKCWAALLLPTENLKSVGISMTLGDLELTDPVPDCYTYDEDTGGLDWADGYEEGGAHVDKRKYPVLYFDQRDFPRRAQSDWVKADKLEPYDAQTASAAGIPHTEKVREYIQRREKMAAEDYVYTTDSSDGKCLDLERLYMVFFD